MKLVLVSFADVYIPQTPNPNVDEVSNVCDRCPGTKASEIIITPSSQTPVEDVAISQGPVSKVLGRRP